jgi:hypothetical protein
MSLISIADFGLRIADLTKHGGRLRIGPAGFVRASVRNLPVPDGLGETSIPPSTFPSRPDLPPPCTSSGSPFESQPACLHWSRGSPRSRTRGTEPAKPLARRDGIDCAPVDRSRATGWAHREVDPGERSVPTRHLHRDRRRRPRSEGLRLAGARRAGDFEIWIPGRRSVPPTQGTAIPFCSSRRTGRKPDSSHEPYPASRYRGRPAPRRRSSARI